MRALLSGATGFIGRHLAEAIDQPVVLSRRPKDAERQLPRAEVHGWDPLLGPPPPEALRGVEAVFHLAGESVGEGRWTSEKKRRIRESRVAGTTNLVRGLAASADRPHVLVSASAIGYYGSRGDEVLDESSAAGNDFLAQVCQSWEDASSEARSHGVRVVNPRFGIVLGRDGGALPRMLTPFKLGLGGRLGSGRQWMSWVHIQDVVGLLLHAAASSRIDGPLNVVAPHPVTNRDFTRQLGQALHRPAVLPAPAFGLRLLIGQFAEVLLGSQRVAPRIAAQTGYDFKFEQLSAALDQLVGGDDVAHQPAKTEAP